MYDWTKSQEYLPIFTSSYPDIIDGFMSSRFLKIENGYNVKNNGELKTLRIDSKEHYPDYKRSGNILGHRFVNDSLYIFLGSKDESSLTLTKTKPSQLHMVWSDFVFEDAQLKKERIILKGRSLKNKKMKFFIGKDRKILNNTQVNSIHYEGEYATLEFKALEVDTILELVR